MGITFIISLLLFGFGDTHQEYINRKFVISLGLGFLRKSFQSRGILRKKYAYLAIGILFWQAMGVFELILPFPLIMALIRIGIIITFILWYYGLKEEEVGKKPKIKPEKDIKVEDGIFRIYQRPDQITEEEVIFHKEKKICLVCKSEAIKYVYICGNCEALYCNKCAETLTDLENECWVCNTPFDENKPSKPFKEGESESKPEILDKGKKIS